MTQQYVDQLRDESVRAPVSTLKVPILPASILSDVPVPVTTDFTTEPTTIIPGDEFVRLDEPTKVIFVTELPLPPPKHFSQSSNDPLTRYSLINETDALQEFAEQQTPLLGDIFLNNQTGVLYAKPNTGKTLIILWLLQEAVCDGRILGYNCYYVAADDNPAGIVEKQIILMPLGINVISPGLKGFSASMLYGIIEEMIRSGTARGKLLILDTLKKFADLMDKRNSSVFADLARRFVMAGGTIVALAHTNKRTDRDGRPIFAGTSDILDDFDCGHTLVELPQQSIRGVRVVQFDCLKRRGNVVQQVAYSYSVEEGISYPELLNSVRKLDPEALSRVRNEADEDRDADVIATIEDCIREGITAKQDLAREAVKRARVGRNKAAEIIDRYAGENPDEHHWTFVTLAHGRREYRLHKFGSGLGYDEQDPSEIY